MNGPMVSVLTTAFNREKYIGECIKSVLNSSFRDWEMIIVDDCSSDHSVSIAREYEKQDARIKVYVNEKNLGDYPNRNMAASFATGKYLKYLDADDIIYPYSLSIMAEVMERHPETALGLSFNVIDDLQPYPQLVSSHDAVYSFFKGRNILGVGPSAAIIRRDAFEEVGGFSGKQYIGDSELWLNLASGYPVVKLQPALVWWRQHEGQQMFMEKKDLTVQKIRFVHKIEMLNKLHHLLSSKEISEAVDFSRYRYGRDILNQLFRKKNPSGAFTLFRDSDIGLSGLAKSFLKIK